MTRVVALVPDLLFGSRVQGQLAAAGHDVELVGNPQQAREHLPEMDVCWWSISPTPIWTARPLWLS